MRKEIRYKTIPEDKKSRGHAWRLNKWYKVEGDIKTCSNGFHCSRNIIDAMGYVTPGYIAQVEVRGKSSIEDDKEAWEEMRILKWEKWTKKDSVALAIFAAEQVLHIYEDKYPKDLRPREAIEAAKAVLKSDTKKNRAAARAAETAARAAETARAAGTAGWAAETAARAAGTAAETAETASWAASWAAAGDAAGDAVTEKCHQFVLKRKSL